MSLVHTPFAHYLSATEDVLNELQRLRETFETLTNCECLF